MDIYIHMYTHNGILFRHKKELNFAICSDMDGLRGHYAKWAKSDRKRQNTVWYHLHMESEK